MAESRISGAQADGLLDNSNDDWRLCMADLLRRALRAFQESKNAIYSLASVGEQKKPLMVLTGKAQWKRNYGMEWEKSENPKLTSVVFPEIIGS